MGGGIWTTLNPVTPPIGGRAKHTLVALPGSKAIAICGTFTSQDDDLGTNTTALFDLTTRTWSKGPSLPPGAPPRVYCSAIWIPAVHKVLIFGGLSSPVTWSDPTYWPGQEPGATPDMDYVRDCYLYDPRNPTTIAATASLPPGHISASLAVGACVMADGRVLKVGGMVFPNATEKCTIYDALRETWTPAAPMHFPRGEYGDPVLLGNGKILVAGGTNPPPGADGWTHIESHLSSAEIYDPVRDTWTLTDPMITPAAQPGDNPRFHPETAFDETAFAPRGSPPDWLSRRWFASSVPLADGSALIIGGVGSFTPPTATGDRFGNTTYYARTRPSCLIYNDHRARGQKWNQTGNLNTPSGGGFAKRGPGLGWVIKIGGVVTPGNARAVNRSAACEYFEGESWERMPDLPSRRGNGPIPIFNTLEIPQYADIFPNQNQLLLAFGLPDTSNNVFDFYTPPANPVSALFSGW